MSTSEPEFDPDDYVGLQPKLTEIHPAELRKLRKAQRQMEEMQAQLAELQRRELFAGAGVPLQDPATKWFVKGYDGEMTVEAIRAAAVEAKILASASASPAEIAGHQNAAAAAAGADPVGVGPNLQNQLAEMAKKTFAPTDDVGRANHIVEIARVAKEAGIRIPLT